MWKILECAHWLPCDPGGSGVIRSMPEQTGEKEIMKIFSLIKLARACFFFKKR